MSTESVVASKVEKYLVSMGWKVQREIRDAGLVRSIALKPSEPRLVLAMDETKSKLSKRRVFRTA